MNQITVTLGGALDLILHPAPPAIVPVVTVWFQGFSVTAKGEHMAYTLPVGMQVHAAIGYVDAGGNPAVVDGDVAWGSSNSAVADVVVDPQNSMACTIAARSAAGTAQITATADADLGSGVRTLVTLLDFTVVPGEAVAGTISIQGEAEPIPPARSA